MRKKTMRTKALCLVTTCCFLSAVHLSPARALEQQHNPLFQVSDRISCEELWQNLISSSSPGNKAFLNEGMPDNIRAAALDLPGLIVLYNIFMFIPARLAPLFVVI